ncbi:MAG: hypothetical protein ABI165_11155 [Bryobacteraceae bacterium]
MDFDSLQHRLLDRLRAQVHNGETTERNLARRSGISQPHMHNMLKGVRMLTPEMGDQILRCLRWSLLDLLEPEELLGHATRMLSDLATVREIPVLAGRLGPGQTWPCAESPFERFPVECSQLASTEAPVVARLGPDARLALLFQSGDLVLLDRSERRRRAPVPDQLYAVNRGGDAVVRWVRRGARRLYLIAPDCLNQPDAWEPLGMADCDSLHCIVARVLPIVQKRKDGALHHFGE